MALIIADRVKETSTTTGTGTYTLAGAVTGFETFGSIGDGNTTYYGCTDGAGNFEVGVGTYASSGTTLARTSILQSSNSDSAVNWPAGTKTLFCTMPAQKVMVLDSDQTSAANKLPFFNGASVADVTDLSAYGRSLIDDADASAARTTLNVDEAGTAVALAIALG